MSSRLEQYLEEVSKPISSHERVEWRTEAEQHLAALIAAYEELGYSQEEATELALNRFGEAQTVGKQVRAEMRPVMFSPATVAFLAPLLLSFVVMYLAASSFAETGNQHTLPMMLTKSGPAQWNLGARLRWVGGAALEGWSLHATQSPVFSAPDSLGGRRSLSGGRGIFRQSHRRSAYPE